MCFPMVFEHDDRNSYEFIWFWCCLIISLYRTEHLEFFIENHDGSLQPYAFYKENGQGQPQANFFHGETKGTALSVKGPPGYQTNL